MEILEQRRENLCLKFANKCTKIQKTRDIFPENKKLHETKTRNTEKFKGQHANTERLKKSSVIYMQNLLNENELMLNQ